MNYKKFIQMFLLVIVIFLTFNFLTWNLATKYILERNEGYITGDLARMGYITDVLYKRKNVNNLQKKHFEVENYNFQKTDLITLGDSFSNGAGGGLNRYYQDYVATYLNWNVLNIYKYKKYNDINTILAMLNSGYLNKTGVKYILYEAVQRKVVDRLLVNIDFDTKSSIEKIEKFYDFGKPSKSHSSLQIPKTNFINNGNFKYVLYNFLYHFSNHAFISKVYIEQTIQNISSTKPYNKLLFYKREITSIPKNTEQNLRIVNKNLNRLSKLLNEQGIKLIFMPAVSKLDLYSPLMLDNKYPKDPFFNIFRTLKKDYIFIDTKAILSKELENGTKDVFYADDTHWSYKASDVIVREIKSLLLLER